MAGLSHAEAAGPPAPLGTQVGVFRVELMLAEVPPHGPEAGPHLDG